MRWVGAHLCDGRESELEVDGRGHGVDQLQLLLLLIAFILECRSAVLRHQAVHFVGVFVCRNCWRLERLKRWVGGQEAKSR